MVIFFCLNWLHPFRAKSKFESHKKVCENKDFCGVVMPCKETKIREFNHRYRKCDKAPSIIYADLESLIKK